MSEENKITIKKRSPQECVGLVLRGFCMGTADVIPGVSGGTMAFIMGIYEELIESIQTFASAHFWNSLIHGRIRETTRMINWTFLACIALGISIAIFTLAHTLEYILEEHPLSVWSFFFGLVLASVFIVGKRIKQWKWKYALALICGAIAAYLLVGLVPMQTPNTWWFLVFAGAVAICAMILPGISGAFLLVMMGKYQTALTAVNDRDFLTIGLFAIGAIIGLVLFSDVLSWLFHHYHNRTVVFLMGLMLGSLRKIWPWKTDVIDMANGNIIPAFNQELCIGICMMIFGILLVILIEWWALHSQKKQ